MSAVQKGGVSILAVDVGAGTQDVLFLKPGVKSENNIKFVLPSQTQILARRIYNMKGDLLITGETMGGGPISNAIRHHIKMGYRVVMTGDAAKTVRDDTDQVRKEGIEIVTSDEAGGLDLPRIVARDVDLDFIFNVLGRLGEGLPDFIGVAVQDHGFEKDKSDRAFRFEKIRERIEDGAGPEDFLFKDPPGYLSRMNAVLRDLKGSFEGEVAVVDTKFAAIAGALHGVSDRPCMCIDIGNGHTMAAVVSEGIDGILEHHTHRLTTDSLEDYVTRLAEGEVTNEEVFEDKGHGCHVKNVLGMKNIKRVLVSGPNRKLLKDSRLRVEFVSPFGDVMMTGPVGIVSLVRSKYL